ncbi:MULTISPECIES: DUF6838 family protein [unclassified Dehalobacter]|uniref:phage tail terminator family protein n=1 Tax=unclassified Dehalobacter TaxID=2635733 RepID=UPI000E6CDBD1|nr:MULTISPECIES: hypothetical protein [unclassified Dehalobacter]RJE48689.1 hypothetical protein A7K50_10180 [Dehalobacter sp. MCB1]TCX53396.1 hypothetical protein C1I36_01180 [Dehalobacter sp. 14DCB1]TCX54411.1 hypothetical protein C1I38_06565 [Dehalobacter sp. 12DCB1]
MQAIIDAVSSLVQTAYPDYDIYLEEIQEGFSRPSFSVVFIQETQTDKNQRFYARNIILYVIFNAALNANNNPDKAMQYTVYENIRELFSSGFFSVGDRKIKIRQITGGPKGKEIYLGFNLDTTESRPEPSGQAELAGSMQIQFDM